MGNITRQDLDSWVSRAYDTACNHGFHDKEYPDGHWLMLMVTEISEAVEADRKGKNADSVMLTSLYNYTFAYEYPHNSSFRHDFEKYIKDTVEDELADVCIRIFDFAGLKGIELILSNQPHIKYEYGDIIRRQLFTEFAFKLTGSITFCSVETSLSFVINRIIAYCEIHGIDLKKHIELKMRYNELRPIRNGKSY